MTQTQSKSLPLIEPGYRASIAGRTGSGKSTVGCFLLARSPGHWLILNPKGTKAYANLPYSKTLHGIKIKDLDKSLKENTFTILVPTVGQSNPDNLDNLVSWLHSEYENIGLCVDELYTLHRNGQSGEGLTAWLTRGRELNQSFLGLTQRPSWISKFVFSEADYVGEMSLALLNDRKIMREMMGDNDACLVKLPPHEWLWYDQSEDTLRKFGPVPMLKAKSS